MTETMYGYDLSRPKRASINWDGMETWFGTILLFVPKSPSCCIASGPVSLDLLQGVFEFFAGCIDTWYLYTRASLASIRWNLPWSIRSLSCLPFLVRPKWMNGPHL